MKQLEATNWDSELIGCYLCSFVQINETMFDIEWWVTVSLSRNAASSRFSSKPHSLHTLAHPALVRSICEICSKSIPSKNQQSCICTGATDGFHLGWSGRTTSSRLHCLRHCLGWGQAGHQIPNAPCPGHRCTAGRLLEAFDLAQRRRHGTMALTTSDTPVTHLQRFVIEKQKRAQPRAR